MKPVKAARVARLEYSIPPRARIPSRHNVAPWERIATFVCGACLAVFGLRRRRWASIPALAVSAELLRRAATGHCRLYSTLGISTAGLSPQHSSRFYDDQMTGRLGPAEYDTKCTITLEKPAAQVYARLRNLSELILSFPHIRRVEQSDAQLGVWVAHDGAVSYLRFDVEAVDDARKLVWRCQIDGHYQADGLVVAAALPFDRGTELTVAFNHGGAGPNRFGVVTTRLTRAERTAREYLRAVKQVIETGHTTAIAVRDRPRARLLATPSGALAEAISRPAAPH